MATRTLLRYAGFALASLLMAGSALATPLGFTCISNDRPADCAIGESQLFVELIDRSEEGATGFRFTNAGPAASSIADIYFDTLPNSLLVGAFLRFEASAGVSYGLGANPANLPAGNNVGFNADFSADSNPPVQPNGINPGESLEILFSLPFASLESALAAGDLRIGIHVQGFDGGGSESFVASFNHVPIPEPTSGALLLAGAALLAGRTRRRGR